MSASIHPTAIIEDDVKLGDDVSIGPYSILSGHCELGSGSRVGSHCIIGHAASGDFLGKALKIGRNANIRAHSVIYEGSSFGDNLETGHHVLLREGIIAGINLRAGVYVDVEGRCAIGDYCRLHSAVIVGQGSELGDFVWMFPNTVLPNDPLPPSPFEHGSVMGSGSVMCTGAILQPGTVLGEGAYITANSVGKGKVPPGAVVNGPNGKIITHVTKLFSRVTGTHHPWMNDFAGRYPPEAQEELEKLRISIQNSADGFRF